MKAATLWKNGGAIRLSGRDGDAWVQAVAVSGNDVCVVGTETKTDEFDRKRRVTMLWKNGVALCLSGQKCYRESDYDYGLDDDDDDETECDPAE
jgi:hypothetical protein